MISKYELFSNSVERLSRDIQKLERMEMARYGLKGPHAQCLLALSRYPQGMIATELCELCEKDKAAISRIVAELEEAGLVQRMERNGTRYRATFMNRVVSSDYRNLISENKPEVMSVLEISDETYQAMLDGMILVNHGEHGTATDYFEGFQYTVAGKTGTAEDDPSGSDNGAYICFAPVEDPQIAIAMYVEKGGHGNTMAMAARYLIEDFLTVEEVKDVPSYENKMS